MIVIGVEFFDWTAASMGRSDALINLSRLQQFVVLRNTSPNDLLKALTVSGSKCPAFVLVQSKNQVCQFSIFLHTRSAVLALQSWSTLSPDWLRRLVTRRGNTSRFPMRCSSG
ncbi:unnamed protein product [Larinioides sclopetarius]|uniref:Uncharacterized protein n=1 Tax=Larinioides sclopetarius TaxID=280406 RepID=A0AAV1ZV20_9ARAC